MVTLVIKCWLLGGRACAGMRRLVNVCGFVGRAFLVFSLFPRLLESSSFPSAKIADVPRVA